MGVLSGSFDARGSHWRQDRSRGPMNAAAWGSALDSVRGWLGGLFRPGQQVAWCTRPGLARALSPQHGAA